MKDNSQKSVYVLGFNNNSVKIGVSKNVAARIRAITTNSGLSVLNSYQTQPFEKDVALTIEKACHDNFSTRRIKGEFFNIAFVEACTVLEKIVADWKAHNGIQIFDSEEFGKIRVIMIDNEPWFVAADVCRALDLSNVTEALRNLDNDEKAEFSIPEVSSNGVKQLREFKLVNEPGLYRLIFKSRKKSAKKFQWFVYHEVLPQIRKTGAYIPKVPVPMTPREKILAEIKEELKKPEYEKFFERGNPWVIDLAIYNLYGDDNYEIEMEYHDEVDENGKTWNVITPHYIVKGIKIF